MEVKSKLDQETLLFDQEKLFYNKLLIYEKEYITKNIKNALNKDSKKPLFDYKIKQLEEIILEIINLQNERLNNENCKEENKSNISFTDSNTINKTTIKNIIKKIKKLSREEGGFMYMPYRIILYNFSMNLVNSKNPLKKIKKDNSHNLVKSNELSNLKNYLILFLFIELK